MKEKEASFEKKEPAKKKQQSAGKNEFRLFRKPRSPFLHVRVMHNGKRRQFSTGERTERAAKTKAVAILADIRSRGFEDALKLHSRRSDCEEVGSDPTIEELGQRFQSNLKFFESAPAPQTARYYARMLVRIGSLGGASRVSELTPDAIQRAKAKYLELALKEGRKKDSAVATLAAMVRNAAGVFSRQSLEAFRQQGLELKNPFTGIKVRGVKLKSYSPLPRDILERIWRESATLISGDPNAGPPHQDDRSGTDFRRPQLAVFATLMLELGLGLRRNEADKARWSWFAETSDGRRFIEVREEIDFKPKSKQSRVVPVAEDVWKALESVRMTNCEYIVPKIKRSDSRPSTGRNYRCDRAHRALVFWLKKRGLNDPKPCHALRKEFGSFVATQFSLFHAQKLLGHSTPMVTSAYYASLTDLPLIQISKMGYVPNEKK